MTSRERVLAAFAHEPPEDSSTESIAWGIKYTASAGL